MRPTVKYLVILLPLLASCLVFNTELTPKGECTTNAECTALLSVTTPTPAVCVQEPLGHCEALLSEDCKTVTGDYMDDRSILIASLLSTTGAQMLTNLPREQTVIMAVEEINALNASGGILQSETPGDTRKLVALSCDEAANLPRVGTHLITDLHVSGIVGPNLSQDTLDLTTGNEAIGLPSSAQGGTVLMSPTALASAIATIPDNNLTYMMVPSDSQRTPLLENQINELEIKLKAERTPKIPKLGIYYRADALGEGTRDGLTSLTFSGTTLSNAINLGKAREDAYDPLSTNNSALVASYVAFQPDIVVLVGNAEAIKYFMTPLEAAWPSGVPKPYYLLIDSLKVAELLTAVTGNDDLRLRVRGTGITTTAENQGALSAFQIAFGQRWKDASGNPAPATQSGMSTSYDAVYAMALALVGKTDVHGPSIAAGIPRLATNTQPCASDVSGVLAPCFTNTDHSRTLYNNMKALLQGQNVTEIGTGGRLEWDGEGAKASGAIEVWCINAAGPKPIFASSGKLYDVKTQTSSGSYVQCAP
jgi:ABC-type branched-subunit amino acid transport system substrate-binding protein